MLDVLRLFCDLRPKKRAAVSPTPNERETARREQMGILCAHVRHEWNNLSSAPFVIFERAGNALQSVFKRVIYIVRKMLSRGMKAYNEFAHISNTVDIHNVCRDFG